MNQIADLKPRVNMGATQHFIADQYPFTIIEVINDRKIVVQEDFAFRKDNNGLSESQTWVFEPDKKGAKRTLTRRKNGVWLPEGKPTRGAGYGFTIGARRRYVDPSF